LKEDRNVPATPASKGSKSIPGKIQRSQCRELFTQFA